MSSIAVKLYPDGSDAPLPLGDITNPREHGVEGITGDERREIDVVTIPEADSVTVFARGNRSEALTIRVARLHPALGKALLYWLKHPQDVPLKADVSFSQSNEIAWLNGCGVQRVARTERIGVTTIFEYALVGGTWAEQRIKST